MRRHKKIDRICWAALTGVLILSIAFMGAAAGGMIQGETGIGYENRLFDPSRVHTIDIVMQDWEEFIDTCANEEYASCALVIDGESYKNAAIRGKGNTSLSSVSSYGNDRYSFKIEFDHYQAGQTYHGLDKLSLNNLIQDTTHMKDYLAYTMMRKMGVAAPLCSYVQVNVNGEPWGFYLAVEGVEDGFLKRNYGKAYGDLYKPDSLSFGGGRGNGMDFDMDSFREDWQKQAEEGQEDRSSGGFGNAFSFPSFGENGAMNAFPGGMQMPGGMQLPEGMQMPDGAQMAQGQGMQMPEMDFSAFGGNMGGFGGMGSSDVKLIYSDDDPESYANIFNSAKTDVTQSDQKRLIEALKRMNAGDTGAVDTDQAIRYLAVHHFLCNGDSYTGTMVHNYYLYEEKGVLSMIPWDYNLAFGAFQMGGFGGSGATSTVNDPIDTPVSSGSLSDRPMIAWIFESEEYTAAYHAVYQELVDTLGESGWLMNEIERVQALIDPYVRADENFFYTYEEFETGMETLQQFCEKRMESVKGQLQGTIPSTRESQQNSDALIDASSLNLSSLGSMGGGRNMDFSRGSENRKTEASRPKTTGTEAPETKATEAPAQLQQPENGAFSFPSGMQMPGNGREMPSFPEGMQMPGNMPGSLSDPIVTETEEPPVPEETPLPSSVQPSASPQASETSRQESRTNRNWPSGGNFSSSQRQQNTPLWEQSWFLLSLSAGILLAGLLIAGCSKGRN